MIAEIVRALRYRYRKFRQLLVRKLPQRRIEGFPKRIKKILRREDKIRRKRLSFALLILASSFFASVYAYNAEEINFDKRAFGYFSSMNAEREAKCPLQTTNETQQVIGVDCE
jgi:hypothetical protein